MSNGVNGSSLAPSSAAEVKFQNRRFAAIAMSAFVCPGIVLAERRGSVQMFSLVMISNGTIRVKFEVAVPSVAA